MRSWPSEMNEVKKGNKSSVPTRERGHQGTHEGTDAKQCAAGNANLRRTCKQTQSMTPNRKNTKITIVGRSN